MTGRNAHDDAFRARETRIVARDVPWSADEAAAARVALTAAGFTEVRIFDRSRGAGLITITGVAA